MKRFSISTLVVAGVTLSLRLSCSAWAHDIHDPAHQPRLSALKQTLIAVPGHKPLHVSELVTAEGATLAPQRLQARWSLLVFGYTACPDVCPATLHVLSLVARDAASGVSAGATQIIFVSVDPKRDTPERVMGHLQRFDRRILGVTGSQRAIERFGAEVGAAARASASGIDHSTSVFVVDPQGRLAGIFLRPSDPARIVGDLTTLRRAYAGAQHASLAR